MLFRSHLKEELVPPDHINSSLSAGFSQIIEMMMAKDVSRRYQTASDVIEDLDTVLRGETPHFAQPTLDFVMLAEVAQTSPSSIAVPQEDNQPAEGSVASMWLPMLIVGAIVNLILIVLVLAENKNYEHTYVVDDAYQSARNAASPLSVKGWCIIWLITLSGTVATSAPTSAHCTRCSGCRIDAASNFVVYP